MKYYNFFKINKLIKIDLKRIKFRNYQIINIISNIKFYIFKKIYLLYQIIYINHEKYNYVKTNLLLKVLNVSKFLKTEDKF